MWQALKESSAARALMGYASLFTSLGTLVCCALPSALVLLGFGATVAGFLSKFPELIWLSEHKEWVFGLSFLMLGLSWLGQRSAQQLSCPVDQKAACESAKNWARPLFFIALIINLLGATYAFILPRLL